MKNSVCKRVFFVDDDPKICRVVAETLEETGVCVQCFTSAADCLKEMGSQRCDLLITDVRMPRMDGLQLLQEAKSIAPWLPVLVVSGYADVPMAVAALKAGAADFIEKPLRRDSLLRKVSALLEDNEPGDADLGRTLTKSELRVLRLVVNGKSNKEIASTLHRSVRTVEVHRSHIMHKLGVCNLVDLIRRAAAMGLVEIPGRHRLPADPVGTLRCV